MEHSALLELVAALKHDLGKYVAWRSANLDEAAWTGPVTELLVESLQADVLSTRQTKDGPRTAWEVFDAVTAELPRPLAEPELREVDTAVGVLRDADAALRSAEPARIAEIRGDVRAAQSVIRAQLRDLHRRLLREA
jgi:hypothetical protein